jgi:hypothetical protein
LQLEKAYLKISIHRDSALNSASEVHSYAKRGREAEDEPKDGSRVEKKKAAAKQRQWIEN